MIKTLVFYTAATDAGIVSVIEALVAVEDSNGITSSVLPIVLRSMQISVEHDLKSSPAARPTAFTAERTLSYSVVNEASAVREMDE